MMKRLIIILVPFLLFSCSVLEDRTPCPSRLIVDYTEAKPYAEKTTCEVISTRLFTSNLYDYVLERVPTCPDVDTMDVKKGMVQVSSLLSTNRNYPLSSDERTVVYSGKQMDSLYSFFEKVDCTDEQAYAKVMLNKQFSTIFFTDDFDGDFMRKYDLVVKGGWNGLDLLSNEPVQGSYSVIAQSYSKTEFAVRVPRLGSDDLVLEMIDRNTGQMKYRIPIGEYIFQSGQGYDVRASALKDYHVKIEFRKAIATIRIEDWDEEYVYMIFK